MFLITQVYISSTIDMEKTEKQMTMEPPHIYVERTLAIIKPDVLHKADEIEDIILRSGFAILQVSVYLIYLCLYFCIQIVFTSL